MTDPRLRDAGSPDSSTRASGDELQELRRVVTLLRELPDPEPPTDLVANVMARVAEDERRRNGAFRRLAQPGLASALAAGVAGLLVYTALQGVELPATGPVPIETGALAPRVAVREAVPAAPRATPTTTVVTPRRFAAVPRRANRTPRTLPSTLVAQGGTFFGSPPGIDSPTATGFTGFAAAASPDRNLDRQLNQLLMDPRAFFNRLEAMSARDRFVARLAERSARRGDAAEVALRLRSTRHPAASNLSERFLHAALVEYVGR